VALTLLEGRTCAANTDKKTPQEILRGFA